MIGETVSHYKILEQLGEGGMGIVYKAEDTKLKRHVALKFLPFGLTSAPESKERFVIEARAAAALNHPAIVTVYEIDEFGRQVFIAMEYVRGENLGEKIEPGPMAVDDVLRIAIQAAEGLQAAHEKGIIHRDIKSANIMIDEKGKVKIMDFGLAKQKGGTKVTREGTRMGTGAYMSPEQVQGEDVDHRTDIWSLGVVLYEILSGQLPFKGEYMHVVFNSIINKEPEPLNALRTGISGKLAQIVGKALTKDLSQRYQSADDMLGDLKTLIKEIEFDTMKELAPIRETKPSIAVLPFEDMSPGKDQDYFCDGMAEELIDAFTKIGRLRVASRTSAFQFKGKVADIHKIGEKLNVQTVLEGSVRKSGNRLRITAQLVNAADGYQIWSEKYDRDFDDIFSIQDEISLAIVENLKVELLGDEKAKLVKRFTEDQDAYHMYLKGRYFWSRRHEGGMNKAVEYFRQAIEQDPLFAFPYVGIADSLNLLGFFGFIPPNTAFPKAKDAANKALEIDNTLGEAYASLAWISSMYDWDWATAEKQFDKSIALNPNYATAHSWYALYLALMGRHDDAVSEVEKGLELDPLSLIINSVLGLTLFTARRYDEAVLQFKKTLEMEPDFQLALNWLGLAYISLGKAGDAVLYLEKAMQLPGGKIYAAGFLGMSYAQSGQKEKALDVLSQVDTLLENGYAVLLHKAFLYMGLGEMDRAFETLEKAFKGRESQLVFFKEMPFLDPLRSDPRCGQLLKKIGLET